MARTSRPRRGTKSPPRRRIKTHNSSRGPTPIDIHVGARVRLRRHLLGMNQTKLAGAIGVIYQQIQKYEKGTDRISASRLFNLGRALDVPVSFFFEDLSPAAAGGGKRRARGLSEAPAAVLEPILLSKRETVELIRAYYRVKDPRLRKRVLNLLQALGKSP